MVDAAMFPEAGMRSIVGGAPIAGIMATGAIGPEHSAMEARVGMATGAVSRRTAETLAVAAAAGEVGVCPCQSELGPVVVEGGWLPGSGRVTGFALRGKATIVFIVLGMTGAARGWSTFKDTILVALCAIYREVRACQLKDG